MRLGSMHCWSMPHKVIWLVQKAKPSESGSRLRKSRYCRCTKKCTSSIGLKSGGVRGTGCHDGSVSLTLGVLVMLVTPLPSAFITKRSSHAENTWPFDPEVKMIFVPSGDQARS